MTANDYGCLLSIFKGLFDLLFGWIYKPKQEEEEVTEPDDDQIVV